MAAILGALVAGDIVTTIVGLSLGGVELNPLGPVVALTVKVLAVAFYVGLIHITRNPRGRVALFVPMVAVLSMPVAWNLSQLAPVFGY